MTSQEHSNNFAARMGRWSAEHRRKAVLGWIAFVVVAFALGMVAGTKISPVLAAVAAAQRSHPQLRIEEFGDASATKALNDTVGKDFQRAEYLSIPVTLAILIVAFGALVAAGIPLLLGLTSVLAAL